MKPFAFQMALALTLMCGCHSTPAITRAQAVAVAEAEVHKRGWKEIEVGSASQEAGIWQVTIWRLPKVPGGHAVIEVSKAGVVVAFWPGS